MPHTLEQLGQMPLTAEQQALPEKLPKEYPHDEETLRVEIMANAPESEIRYWMDY